VVITVADESEFDGLRRREMRRSLTARVARAATVGTAGLALLALVSGCSEHRATGQVPPAQQLASEPGSASPRPLVEGSPTLLAPGTYQLAYHLAADEELPDAYVDIPSGFDEAATWYVVSHDRQEFLGLWTVSAADRDACRRGARDAYDPGPTVEDLADALVAQKSTRASTPEPVSLAGYHGLYVELASPQDLRTCGPEPGLWTSGPTGGRGIYGDGQVDLVWILDMDGQRIVVNASYSPRSTAADIYKLNSMVESLQFAPAAQE